MVRVPLTEFIKEEKGTGPPLEVDGIDKLDIEFPGPPLEVDGIDKLDIEFLQPGGSHGTRARGIK